MAACSAPEKPLSVVTDEVLSLQTEWPFTRLWSGVFTNPGNGEEFIYSGDPVTHRKVRVFDELGTPVRDIPLGLAIDSLGSIRSFTLIAPDSLFVLEGSGTKYAIIDANGKVVRVHSLEPYLCDANGDKYKLFADGNGLAQLGTRVFVGSNWQGACNAPPDAPFDPVVYYEHYTRKCNVAAIDRSGMSKVLRFGACDVFTHLTDVPRCTAGTIGAVAVNGSLFTLSRYSPDVMQLDTASLEVIRRIPIRYSQGAVGIKPPPASFEDENNDGSNLRTATKAYVYAFLYDANSGHYIAVVYHEVPEDTPEEQRGSARNWSLLILDSTFNQIAEHVLDGVKFQGTALLCTKRGTWVPLSNPGLKAVGEAKLFHRLRV